MANYRTSGCKSFDQKEIVLSLSDCAATEPTWLLDYFTESIKTGSRFRAEQTVQAGWMILKLKENPEGDLEAWEPRFGPVPIEWVIGVNKTIRHVVLQKLICESLHQDPVFPSILQAGIVDSSFWESGGTFSMKRSSPNANDSGWCFFAQTNDGSDKKFYSLFEIASRVSMVIPFLAMPPGANVKFSKAGIIAEYKGSQISSDKDELLRKLYLDGFTET